MLASRSNVQYFIYLTTHSAHFIIMVTAICHGKNEEVSTYADTKSSRRRVPLWRSRSR